MNFCNNVVELQAVCMLVQFVNFPLVKIHQLQLINVIINLLFAR